MYSPLVFDPVNLFAAQSVAASTTSDPSARLETTRLTKVQVRVKNTGASTNVTVNIYSVDAATTRVLLSPTTATAGKQYYVSAKDATTFTITIDSAAEADISFDWQAVI